MFLRHTASQDLVEVMDMDALVDPCKAQVRGRYHAGEEMQEPEGFEKSLLVFPSGESLPECWRNPSYSA